MIRPDIVANVRFYTTAEGGRKEPTGSDFLNCPMELGGELFDCRLLLEGIGPLAPGQTATVPVKFLNRGLVSELLKPGTTFRLWSFGSIAEGTIEEVLPE